MVLKKYCQDKASGCLKFSWQSVKWSIYLFHGSFIYITHGIRPDEKFERNLLSFRKQNPNITNASIAKLKVVYHQNVMQENSNAEYKTLYWLYTQKILSTNQTFNLIFLLIRESLESLLLLAKADFNFITYDLDIPIIVRFDLEQLLVNTGDRIKYWKLLAPEIKSSYQSPYLFRPLSEESQSLDIDLHKQYGNILTGYNFRQLGAKLFCDELVIAKRIQPFISKGLIKLNEPNFPFNSLPNLYQSTSPEKTKQIVCVDDSLPVIQMIDFYLKPFNIKVNAVTESPKAMTEIIRLKPDLVLLDINMPDLDGYCLCVFIRQNSELSQIPIIMVTGKNGIINRAKAKIHGATDYLTKPFSKEQLQNKITKYLV
ncbi:response regulator [Gloeocapsa sp. PCC 73106]|uniref:response regulator n=1 Tax=Gloeocapsa sp. PCC 73106 TaxID=102232 RepID=UPI0002ACB6D8|nr:response regulator [Gloeocapsa sp. PCC 73106]ELR97567.1 response regulator containing a CheY-like receiver domain and a GGDEF domain [Gloeocapsa sp. PCC 73106]